MVLVVVVVVVDCHSLVLACSLVVVRNLVRGRRLHHRSWRRVQTSLYWFVEELEVKVVKLVKLLKVLLVLCLVLIRPLALIVVIVELLTLVVRRVRQLRYHVKIDLIVDLVC